MSNTITITKRYVAPDASVGSVYVSTPSVGNAVSDVGNPLNIATTTTLGGIIVSSGLTITPDGYLSVSGGTNIIIDPTPVANQVTFWKTENTIKGSTGLTFLENGKLFVSGGTITGEDDPDRTLNVFGGIYSEDNLEFPANRTIYMGFHGDSGARYNIKQRTGGIDEGAYVDFHPKLTFRGGASSSVSLAVLTTGGTFNLIGGLHVGSLDDTAGADNLLVDGRGTILGGLHVGGTSDAGTDNLLVDGTISNNLQYNNGTFTSGFFGAGHRLQNTGGISSLEVDDLIVRRKLSAYELEIREITSIGGSLVISVGNCTIYDIQGSNYIVDSDQNRNPIQFAVGDIIRAQVWTGRGTDSWIAVVTNVTQSTTLGSAYFQATNLVGDGGWVGAKCVVVGSSNSARNNIIYLTAADSDNPYISVLNGVTGSTFAGHERLRLGSLAGVLDPAFGSLVGQYGLYCDNIYLKGRIQISSGSGYGNLSDKPTSLAGINGTEGTKLSGIEAGATVGATWGTNIGSQPTSLAGINSTEGSKLSGIEAGATLGANWNTNITNKPTLGSLAALNTADWNTNVSGKPGYTGPASGRGLFMSDTYMGYYNYTDYPSDPWRAYISSDGTARFVNVTEFGTQPSAGWLGLTTNVAVNGPNIYEPMYNGTSALNINMLGYQGSTSQYRQLQIGDGRGTTAVMFNSRTSSGGYTYGTTVYYQDVSLNDGCYIGGYFRQGDHSKDPYASLATAHGINVGSGNDVSRFQGTVDFYGYNSNFSYTERVMSINPTDMYVNKPLTIHDTCDFDGAITSSSPTIDFNGCHYNHVIQSDDTCAVTESDIAGSSRSVTPKGDKIHVQFSLPVYTTSSTAGGWFSINVGGNNYWTQYHYVNYGSNVISGNCIVDVTPNSAVTVKLRWSGTTAYTHYGSTGSYGYGTITIIDLY